MSLLLPVTPTNSRFTRAIAVGLTATLIATGVGLTMSSPAVADEPVTGDIAGYVDIADADLGSQAAGEDDVLVTAWKYEYEAAEDTHSATAQSTTVTDTNGAWVFSGLPVGEYEFQFEYRGAVANIVNSFSSGAHSLDEALYSYVVDAPSSDAFLSYGADSTATLNTLLEVGGVITGSVSSSPAGAPLAGQPVEVWRYAPTLDGTNWEAVSNGEGGTVGNTASNGTYTFVGLPSGSYAVRAGGASGFIAEFWSDLYVSSPEDADDFYLYSGETLTRDFELVVGSRVSGTVKTTSGTALKDILVTAWEGDSWGGYTQASSTSTGSTGKYTLDALAAGDYIIQFESPAAASSQYLTEYWNNATTIDDGTPLNVSPGANRTGIDAALARAASISGTVSLAGGIGDLTFDVSACKRALPSYYVDCDYGNVTVGAGGSYKISNLPTGSYTVRVDYTGTSNFRGEYLSNVHVTTQYSEVPDATYFTLSAGTAVTGKNIILDPGAEVSGVVTLNGLPKENARVEAILTSDYRQYPVAARTVHTASDGSYTITGLDFTEYQIRASVSDGSASSQWLSNQYSRERAASIAFDGPDSSAGNNFALESASTISGTVTGFDPLGGPDKAVESYTVTAYRYLDANSRRYVEVDVTSTNGDGEYNFSGLPPGDYLIEIADNYYAEQGYLSQFAGGVPGQRASSVPKIVVSAGSAVTRNVALTWGGSYTGRVVDAAGNGLGGVTVTVRDESYAYDTTSEDGSFTLLGLLEGPHEIELDTYGLDSEESRYVDHAVQAAAVTTNSAPVTVADIELDLSSTISGVVLGTNGKALSGTTQVTAYVRSDEGYWDDVDYASANSSGGFTLDDLPTGTIYLGFSNRLSGGKPSTYPFQFLGGSSIMELSTPVLITEPGSSAFREARLVTGGSITGIVTNKTTGKPLSGMSVLAQEVDGYRHKSSTTNSTGAYVIPGLEAGGYDMTFNLRSSGNPIGMGFGNELRRVYVPDMVTVKQNAALSPAAKVTGSVKNGTVPLAGIIVTAYPFRDGSVDFTDQYLFDSTATTNSSGNYSLQLARGTYVVRFSDPEGRVAPAWLGGTSDAASSTKVVAASSSLPGRNVLLAPASGSIAATVIDSSGSVPVGYVEVFGADGSQIDFDAEVYHTPYESFADIFPLTNVPEGTYRVVLTRNFECLSSGCAESTTAPPIEFTNVVVTGGVTELNAGNPVVFSEVLEGDAPLVVPGSEPELSLVSPRVGDTVVATNGTWTPEPVSYEYQWLRNGRAIWGATSSSYTAAPGDAGKVLTVNVLARNEQGYGSWAESSKTDPVALADAANPLTAPTITGNPAVGQVLRPTSGTWDIPNLTFSYRWIRSTAGFPDAVVSTSSTYKPTLADVHTPTTEATLAVEITATRAGFESATISVPVAQIQPATAMKQTYKSVVSSVAGGYRVTSGTWSPSGAQIQYEWRRYAPDGSFSTFVTGTGTGTSSTFTDSDSIASSDRLVVLVTARKTGYTPTTVAVLVRQGAPVNITVAPSLSSGPVQVGLPSTVETSGATTLPTGAKWAFQWLRNGGTITGATKASYTPSVTDVGKTLSVRVTAAVSGYASSQAVLPVGVVLAAGTFTPDLTIAGVASVGRVLTAETSLWTPQPTTKTYKWTRNGTAISKATASAYTLVAADLGATIGVTVTGSRSGFATVVESATVSTPITSLELQNLTPPTIGSRASVGSKLTASPGTWDLKPTSYSYQWLLNGVEIAGATSQSYTPIVTNVDEEISVIVVAKKSGVPSSLGYSSTSVTVEPGAAVKASARPLLTVGGKTVTTAKMNSLVVATAGTWPVASLNLSYQWQVNRGDGNDFVDIEGANSKQLRLDSTLPDDFATNYLYRVVVSASRTGYLTGPQTVSSNLKLIP